MRRPLLVLAMLFAGSACAAWVKVSENEIGMYYIDPKTIRTEGNLRKSWGITDYKQRFTNGAISWRVRTEYDCKEERLRLLSLREHSERMASGTTIWSQDYEENSDDWHAIPPGTGVEAMMKFVCLMP